MDGGKRAAFERGVAGRARARSTGHALENFEVHVMSHLLPGTYAVLLHGVAQRLLLRGVPVPSEGHLWPLAPRLGLRLGFHRAVRAARCGPGAIRGVRALGDPSRKRTDAAHPVAAARALASSRARGIERASQRGAMRGGNDRNFFRRVSQSRKCLRCLSRASTSHRPCTPRPFRDFRSIFRD